MQPPTIHWKQEAASAALAYDRHRGGTLATVHGSLYVLQKNMSPLSITQELGLVSEKMGTHFICDTTVSDKQETG